MHSRRSLGTVALVALATAAVSFAVVDVSTSIGSSCATSASSACAVEAVPVVAVSAGILGVVALIVGIVPAVMWVLASVQLARHTPEETERQVARQHRMALRGADEAEPRHDELDHEPDWDPDAVETAGDRGAVSRPRPSVRPD